VSRGLADDRCRQPETTAQFKTQSGINGRLRLSRCARGGPSIYSVWLLSCAVVSAGSGHNFSLRKVHSLL
jgi:hypothetical protein